MASRQREISGAVCGVAVRGRLPEAFRPYLRPLPDDHGDRGTSLELGYRTVRELPEVDELWVSEPRGPWDATEGRFALFREPEGFGLAVSAAGHGIYRCRETSIRMEWASEPAAAAHHLFTHALPLWLETRGVPVLHGSAVAVEGLAVGLLGPSGCGKSVLAAELARSGGEASLLADDGLALSRSRGGGWRCLPGPPIVRLWPTGLDRLGVAADGL
ncbi:MAG: hypothetical protein R3325_15025, partial [Thermoanaerobaculia bacterium]|nr:hypothetical protein [Thermoanaerobaculia bacterium]